VQVNQRARRNCEVFVLEAFALVRLARLMVARDYRTLNRIRPGVNVLAPHWLPRLKAATQGIHHLTTPNSAQIRGLTGVKICKAEDGISVAV
jgi:hypothetical protein